MRIQITVTVNEAKRIIAKGIANLDPVRRALQKGKIFLKGGTTVSAFCEEVIGKKLRISGRITPLGAKTANENMVGFHCALIKNGDLIDVDKNLEETVSSLRKNDVAIIGANAIDAYGNAALMYGAPLGAEPGKIISGLIAEIQHVIIAAGLEKLVPGSLQETLLKVGRKNVDRSMGMAVGLVPLAGQIVSEREAISLIAGAECTVIGRGGIFGAEGGTTMIVEGEKKDIESVFSIIEAVKGSEVSGTPGSLVECRPPHVKCKTHWACIYRSKPKGKMGLK
jgi:hypothetical protein